MKLSVKCEVNSDVILPRRLEVRTGPRTFCFEVDKQGRWNEIVVLADIADPSRIRWGLEPVPEPRNPNHAPANVVGDLEPSL